MGVNFTAVMDHNLEGEQLYTLPELLNTSWNQIQHLLPILDGYPVLNSASEKWHWRDTGNASLSQTLQRVGVLSLDCPDGFIGRAGIGALDVYHAARWWSFVKDELVGSKLRCVCQHIATVLKSDSIVYVPDSGNNWESRARELVFEGKNVNEIIDWLYTNCGPPSPYTGIIRRKNGLDWSEVGYFVEELNS